MLSKLEMVEYRKQEREEEYEYHSHWEYEIYFFHSGKCRYLIHNQIYDLKPGDILVMDGTTLHKPNVSPGSEYSRSVIHFSPVWIENVLIKMGAEHLLDPFRKLRHCLIRTDLNGELERLEEAICFLSKIKWSLEFEEVYIEAEIKVLLLQILTIVYRLSRTNILEKPTVKSHKMEHAENIAAFIQGNYKEKLSIEEIAKALNLSRSYVTHVFKEMTGYTVMEYIMGCRLTQVKYLLEMEPDKALQDIAFESGFESVSHFSRYFKSKVGVTAREYRKLRLKKFSVGDF